MYMINPYVKFEDYQHSKKCHCSFVGLGGKSELQFYTIKKYATKNTQAGGGRGQGAGRQISYLPFMGEYSFWKKEHLNAC